MFTSGRWTVKKGHEGDFVRRWQESADRLALEFPGVTFRLLRDVDDPRRFVSFGGAWRNADQIAASRALPSFQETMAAVQEHLESSELGSFELVAEIS